MSVPTDPTGRKGTSSEHVTHLMPMSKPVTACPSHDTAPLYSLPPRPQSLGHTQKCVLRKQRVDELTLPHVPQGLSRASEAKGTQMKIPKCVIYIYIPVTGLSVCLSSLSHSDCPTVPRIRVLPYWTQISSGASVHFRFVWPGFCRPWLSF